MATKRKRSAPPPAPAGAPPHSSSSSSSSSSDSDSSSHSDPKPVNPAHNHSQSEDSSSEQEKESQPYNKKSIWPAKDVLTLLRSLSEFHAKHERLPSRKECGGSFLSSIRKSLTFAVTEHQLHDKIRELRSHFRQCVWTPEDVVALLRALSEHYAEHGCLPPRNNCEGFLNKISGSISFPITEHKVFKKIGSLRTLYNKRKERGYEYDEGFPLRRPYDEVVHSLCKEVFEHTNTKKRKRKKRLGRASCFYLHRLIREMMMSGEQCLGPISTVEDAMRLIGESKVEDLEVQIKALRIDAIRLSVREEELVSELFGIFVDGMTDDQIGLF